eukprot:TRINITY_DN30676_c0_g1_i1.p1 TRINITY_DN30676_c0_g1~~TRINITY_DN30676_c0_g1_i1.p1  ORF type:complete len:365 (+),score=91.37 TRINITY_DN30676_c0_g1_i1:51-1145(+)
MGFGDFLKKGKATLSAAMDPQKGEEAALGNASQDQYRDAANGLADVYMFSGCADKQTSADVSNVASFGLPSDAGPGGAGGACTNALLNVMYKHDSRVTWCECLGQMRSFLKEKRYTQIPQLSSSRQLQLKDNFEVSGGYSGGHKALLVGINYVNHKRGVLSGCINDVISMKTYIETQGFNESEATMRVLVDDHNDAKLREHVRGVKPRQPTKREILDGIRWLVSGAKDGDCLFFHYSGHGGQQEDKDGDEEDGMDETLIPEDYNSGAGVITDDELFEALVLPLPKGCRLVCVMDCCHSGTILDLPYLFAATEQNMSNANNGVIGSLMANPGFAAEIKKFVKKGILKNFPQAGGMVKFAESHGFL